MTCAPDGVVRQLFLLPVEAVLAVAAVQAQLPGVTIRTFKAPQRVRAPPVWLSGNRRLTRAFLYHHLRSVALAARAADVVHVVVDDTKVVVWAPGETLACLYPESGPVAAAPGGNGLPADSPHAPARPTATGIQGTGHGPLKGPGAGAGAGNAATETSGAGATSGGPDIHGGPDTLQAPPIEGIVLRAAVQLLLGGSREEGDVEEGLAASASASASASAPAQTPPPRAPTPVSTPAGFTRSARSMCVVGSSRRLGPKWDREVGALLPPLGHELAAPALGSGSVILVPLDRGAVRAGGTAGLEYTSNEQRLTLVPAAVPVAVPCQVIVVDSDVESTGEAGRPVFSDRCARFTRCVQTRRGLEDLVRAGALGAASHVFVDLLLPDGDGRDVCRYLRHVAGFPGVIVALTNTASEEGTDPVISDAHLASAGFDFVCRKPLHVTAVREVLRFSSTFA